MSDLNFTPEERNYIERMARQRPGIGQYIWFYVSVFTPLVFFAGYGIINRDFIAEFVAFAGLFMIVIWRIAQECTHVQVLQSALQKIAAHEQASDASKHVRSSDNSGV
jgi:hypothetical protein